MKNVNLHILVAIAFILSASVPCHAGTATLRVSATVLPFVSFDAKQRVATYQVRSEDLQRGYVDLPDSLTVNLRTNLNGPVPVSFENMGEGRILVSENGMGNYVAGSFTMNAYGPGGGRRISQGLDTRIVLPADAREGTYPLAIAMSPVI